MFRIFYLWLENESKLECFSKENGFTIEESIQEIQNSLCEYEIVIGEKLQLRNIRIANIKSFAEYLETENYQVATVSEASSGSSVFPLVVES
jgi:hypothetical protein